MKQISPSRSLREPVGFFIEYHDEFSSPNVNDYIIPLEAGNAWPKEYVES
jgi:hypothetical protein